MYIQKSIATKILTNSIITIRLIKGCKLNGDGANILPDLPNEFKCSWENCDECFECMQYYVHHIAEHLQISEFKKYNFICPWTGL